MNYESKELSGEAYSGTTSGDKKDLTKVLIGALAGAAAGSIIGGLFTEKGVKARKRVSEGSKKISNNLKDKVSDIKEGVADKYEAAKEGAANLIEKGKQKVGITPSNSAYKLSANGDVKGTASKVLLGALGVSIAGTIVWSLATEKGKETRKRLGEGSKNMATNLKDKVSGIKEGIADKYEAAKEGAANLIEKGKQKVGITPDKSAYKVSTNGDVKGTASKVLLGALGVSIAGTIIWSLATEKGKETRKRVGKGSKDIATNLKDKLSNISEGIADTYKTAKEGAVELLEKQQQVNKFSGDTAYKDSTGDDIFNG